MRPDTLLSRETKPFLSFPSPLLIDMMFHHQLRGDSVNRNQWIYTVMYVRS